MGCWGLRVMPSELIVGLPLERRRREALTVRQDGVRCRQQSARCIEHEQRAHTVPVWFSCWDQADGAFPAGQLANRTFFPLV